MINKCLGGYMFLAVLFLLFGLGVENVLAVNGKIGLEARSAYVWRGITRTDGVVIEPYVDVKMGGFGIGVWGNVNVEDYDKIDDQGLFSETDIQLSYDLDVNTAIVGLGYTEYQYSIDRENTRELFVSVRGPIFTDNLFAGIKIFYDIGVIKDAYLDATLDYVFKMVDSLKGDIGGSLGYAGNDMSIGEKSGFNDYSLFFGVVYDVDSNLELGGKVVYTDTLDREVLPDQPVNFFLCLNIARKF
jgi:hypothetical protein